VCVEKRGKDDEEETEKRVGKGWSHASVLVVLL
jgi:hypothetical protein